MEIDKSDNTQDTMTTDSKRSAATAGVLVVDDEFAVRDSLENWFRKDGYRTGTAEDANEALHHLQEASWDVVLLDIKMPGMDDCSGGFTRWIRRSW
jgi:CheY-like chemotaxis protein